MEIEYREAITLIRVINRYLEDHPEGESAGEARELLEKLKKRFMEGNS